MPIIVARTGDIKLPEGNKFTPEQRRRLWEAIVSNWAENNKDALRRGTESKNA